VSYDVRRGNLHHEEILDEALTEDDAPHIRDLLDLMLNVGIPDGQRWKVGPAYNGTTFIGIRAFGPQKLPDLGSSSHSGRSTSGGSGGGKPSGGGCSSDGCSGGCGGGCSSGGRGCATTRPPPAGKSKIRQGGGRRRP
jgi:hypothetical protein